MQAGYHRIVIRTLRSTGPQTLESGLRSNLQGDQPVPTGVGDIKAD